MNNGDRLGARAYANGAVEVYINGTLFATYNVGAWRYAASSGYIGILTLDAPGAVLDDFGGGSVGIGAAAESDELAPEADKPEELHLLRYKSNVWLPAIEAQPHGATAYATEAGNAGADALAEQSTGALSPDVQLPAALLPDAQAAQLYLPVVQTGQ
jgi:hypothetical protein